MRMPTMSELVDSQTKHSRESAKRLPMKEIAEELRQIVIEAAERLKAVPSNVAAEPVAPGKWSPKEIIGHLTDSASNNHGRFVRAQLSDDLIFPGYDQAAWVRLQHYATSDWHDLITLWRGYNLHIAHFIERIPERVLTQPRTRHNLYEIAWRTIPQSEPVTLEYFIRDYVSHLRHHLGQIPL